jgi:toxin ParE1/3/4
VIVWTEQAARQLDQAYEYIALGNSEEVAKRVSMQIVASVQRLETFPMSGRTGRIPGTRELVVPGNPFIAAYTIEEEHVVILAVYHTARQWPEAF